MALRDPTVPGGRALFVEVKRPGGRATVEQVAFLEACRRQGALALLVDDPAGLEAAIVGALAEGPG